MVIFVRAMDAWAGAEGGRAGAGRHLLPAAGVPAVHLAAGLATVGAVGGACWAAWVVPVVLGALVAAVAVWEARRALLRGGRGSGAGGVAGRG